jgi:hypothetical protein
MSSESFVRFCAGDPDLNELRSAPRNWDFFENLMLVSLLAGDLRAAGLDGLLNSDSLACFSSLTLKESLHVLLTRSQLEQPENQPTGFQDRL